MFVKLDARLARVRYHFRTTARDDAGATLVAVLVLMAVGFVVSAIIAAACMFTITQTAQGRTDAQSFAAAEAGRDAVVSVLSQEQAAKLCKDSAAGIGHFKSADGQTPAYEAWVQAASGGTPPTGWDGAVGADDVPAVPSCPGDDTKYIVVRSIGSIAGGGREVIDAVYKWQLGKETVAGGGLGYQGVTYKAALSTINGDMIVKNGNLECNYGTVFNGSVYVLNGNVVVGTDAFFGFGSDACTINGELVVAGTINFVKKCNGVEILGFCIGSYTFGTITVGGPAHVQGSIDPAEGGTLNVGTDPVANDPNDGINDVEDTYTTRDLTVAGHISTSSSGGPTIKTSNGGWIEAADYITAGKPLTAAGGIATGADLTATAAITSNGGDISVKGKILGAGNVTASGSSSIIAGDTIEGTGARTAGGNITTAQSILGSGIVTAGLGVTVKGDIGGTRIVKASGGPIEVGGNITTTGTATTCSSSSGSPSGTVLTCAAAGVISIAKAITSTSATVTAGGGIKVVGDILTTGKVDANGGDLQTGGSLGTGAREASGSITTRQPINTASALTAGVDLITNGALLGNGTRTATGGTISVAGDLSGNGTKTATNFIVTGNLGGDGAALATNKLTVNGTISGNGARQALGGALWGDNSGNLSGSGTKTAKYIFVKDLASSGSVTATENLIIVGNVANSVALTAGTNGMLSIKGSPNTGTKSGGTVLIEGNVTGGAVNASNGNLEITGDVTGSGALTAANGRIQVSGNVGSSGTAATGGISAKTGILVGGLINLNTSGGTAGLTTTGTNASVTAANGDIRTTTSTACNITGDLRAGGILYLPQAGNSYNANISTYPYCTITGKLLSASTSKSTLAASNWRVRVGTTASATVESAANSLANGWGTPSGSGNPRYLRGTGSTTPQNGTTNVGTPTFNGSTTKPTAPTVVAALTAPVNGTMTSTPTFETALTAPLPDVRVPDVTVPSAPAFVLNERTGAAKTWSDIDDLQLRTTWLDLGTYTDWGEKYYKVTVSGARCTTWLGLGGPLTRILNTAGEVRDLATGTVLVPASAENVVIDATGCTNTITMTWAATNLKRDAVILVNNVSFDLASMGSQSATHQLFIVQVDKDQRPQRSPRGVIEPIPNCSTGQIPISISGNGILGDGPYKANVLLYSPCGVSGGWVNSWKGHIYASGTEHVDANVLSTYTCVDMSIPQIISLPCDIDTITDTGHMNIAAYAIGDRLTQTEP